MKELRKQTKKIIELHSKGLTNEEIAEICKINSKYVISAINRKGLKSNRYKLFNERILKLLEQFVIGSMLGDGYLLKIDKGNQSSIKIVHSLKQESYLDWKINFLRSLGIKVTKRYDKIMDDRFKNGFVETKALISQTHPIFSYYRNLFYKNNKKILLTNMIDKIDELALIIWFFDDSSKASSGYQIQTTCFSELEIKQLINHLKIKFDIDSTFQPHRNILYIKTNSVKKLDKILNKLQIPELMYKVHTKQGELLENPEEDNQQPSLGSNTFEGSTTNSRIQTDNAEDSNTDTSALLGYKSSETKFIGINFILNNDSEIFVSNDDIV